MKGIGISLKATIAMALDIKKQLKDFACSLIVPNFSLIAHKRQEM